MHSAGQLLRMRRNKLRISIEQASEDTKIQKKYLQMIEEDRYDEFDSEIFLKGFLKSYSRYLGLKPDKIIAIYRRTTPQTKKENTISESKGPKPVSNRRISPKAVAEIILASFVVVVAIYFGYQLYNFQRVPELNIITPENNITTTDEQIDIEGETEENTIVTINDVSTELDEENKFADKIALNEGINTITIRAIRKNNESKETVEVITITREEKEEDPEEVAEEKPVIEEPVLKDKFTLKVEGGDAWILLLVDGKQEIGQIVPNGFTETYTVKEKVELTTGSYSITKIYLNDETEPVPLNLSSGVGVLSCTLENNQLTCDNQQ